MAVKAIYSGPVTELGRFGPFVSGTVLLFTDKEWACVKGRKDFTVVRKSTRIPKVAVSAQVVKECDPDHVRNLELEQMTAEELRAATEELRQQGFPVYAVTKSDPLELRVQLSNMEKLKPHDLDEDGRRVWNQAMKLDEDKLRTYCQQMLDSGAAMSFHPRMSKAEMARGLATADLDGVEETREVV